MNKYYFPINLIDSIDQIFLAYYSDIIYIAFIILILLSSISILVISVLERRNICKTIFLFYNVLIIVLAIISLSFVYYISIPTIIYITQLLMFCYNKSTSGSNINRKIVFIISGIFIIINILINAFIVL